MYAWPCFKKPRYRCIVCRESVDATELWSEIKAELVNGLLREDRLIPALQAQFDSKETADMLEQEIKLKDGEILKWRCAKDHAFRMGMMLKNYPMEKVQQHIDEAQGHMERLAIVKASLEKQLATLREQTLNIEGIRRLIELLAGNIEKLTKEEWQRLNETLKLKVTVYSSDLYVVNVALPPVKQHAIEISRL
jgi:rRNA maturation endonuclease Nob1